ncbi:hypothetical protein LUZ61_000588 [Rhynchospora tenuis]|uniref:Ankyrin n=1 Tax=Rhynchospora tenuis TaxID=198213 RepID=A0AAD6EPZ0_9POAL|nr:hypothetical protein LUZ61_000588 [Rhynchospora tenuis]
MAVLWQGAMAQVWPLVEYNPDISQKLVDAIATGADVAAYLADPAADVNFAGAVWLKSRRADVVLREEAPDEVRFEYEEIRTDASPLFLAAHSGDLSLVRSLLAKGADVNQRVFKGYPITAAVREGKADVVELLVKSGTSQQACEEAVVEAALHCRAYIAEIVMESELVRSHIAVHALVCASSRGFVDVVEALIKCGADPNAKDRILLRSLKPSLHMNVDCTALFAAIVSRQVAVVQHLLQVGVRKDTKVRLGAWSWDTTTGEELRVGAGLAEPYDATWCAVEFYESSGQTLRLLLQNRSTNTLHLGRSLLHHAILCGNPGAVQTLLSYGANCNLLVKTHKKQHEFRPVHLASRLGHAKILQILISNGCEIGTSTEHGDTALILCARHRQEGCLRVLVSNGADLGALNCAGESAASVANSIQWGAEFQRAVIDVIRAGNIPKSTDTNIFSSLFFSAQCGDVAAINVLLAQPETDINEHDKDGFTPIMVTAREGHVDAFRVLLFTGANVRLCNRHGKSAITFCQSSKKRDLFEQVMLEFALENGAAGGFYALHCAARRGDLAAVRSLVGKCGDVNLPDGDDYTPLMLAAREGHGTVCELLILHGAKCDIKTSRGETALSLARKNARNGNSAVNVILDEISRVLVLTGGRVKKHTKNGKGSPHYKLLKMTPSGMLSWGKSCCRNVICQEVNMGPSSSFVKNRGRRGDANEPGLFRVVTMRGKEVHFVCEGGNEVAELWARGIMLVTNSVRDNKGD